jgi:muramoyltetrapeptide carboxypeptidase
MKRRDFISISAMAGLIPLLSNKLTASDSKNINNDYLKPKALSAGDTVAIISPATAVTDPDDLARAKEVINYFQLQAVYGKNSLKGKGYKTRTIEERLVDLHSAFSDKNIKAVFCIRGGYGSPELLDKIDYKLIRNNPKIFLGYSDITALNIAIYQKSGIFTFHGPMMLSAFTPFTTEYFRKALFEKTPIGEIKNNNAKSNFRAVHPTRTIVSGKAEGRLIGGNLSLISDTMGTPYEIDTKDKILFIEEVGEEPFRIDRMLTQLRLAGKLQSAKGIIFGECADCVPNKYDASRNWDYSLGEILDNILDDLKVPVFYGLTIGHTSDQLTTPIGAMAQIDADQGILNITESCVI